MATDIALLDDTPYKSRLDLDGVEGILHIDEYGTALLDEKQKTEDRFPHNSTPPQKFEEEDSVMSAESEAASIANDGLQRQQPPETQEDGADRNSRGSQATAVETDTPAAFHRDTEEKFSSQREKAEYYWTLQRSDPSCHFQFLDDLRDRVIESSEVLRTQGEFKPFNALSPAYFTNKPSTIPAEVWKHCLAIETCVGEKYDEEMSLFVKTYVILSWVLDNLDYLTESLFCGDSYNLLLKLSGQNIAEIIRLPRHTINNLKESLEPALMELSHESIVRSLDLAGKHCSALLELFGMGNVKPVAAAHFPGLLCWMTAIILDLGLVSFVGSHVRDFGVDMGKDNQVKVECPGFFGFTCQLGHLACLHEFLNRKKVWTFRMTAADTPEEARDNYVAQPLSILTRIEALADVWPPVWSAPTGSENTELVKWYEVANGYIIPVPCHKKTFRNARRCHYKKASIDEMEACAMSQPENLWLHKDDLLLIGARFTENDNCTYCLNEFETSHGDQQRVLGTEPRMWKQDTRTVGVAGHVAKVASPQFQFTWRLDPGTPIKKLIRKCWSDGLVLADLNHLNLLLGVEVSSCTGNARRVTLKSLLLNKAVQPLLERQAPGWKETSWGAALQKALLSDHPDALVELWNACKDDRSSLGGLVICVLKTLETTGVSMDGKKLRAAMFNDNFTWSVQLDINRNSWARCLYDTDQTAAYVILSETCLECWTPDKTTSTCGTSHGYTVLQLQVEFEELHDQNFVNLSPLGLVITKVDEGPLQEGDILMAIPTTIERARHPLRPVVTWHETKKGVRQSRKTVRICIRGSDPTFGSIMKFGRHRKSQTRTTNISNANESIHADIEDQSTGTDSQNPRSECPLSPNAAVVDGMVRGALRPVSNRGPLPHIDSTPFFDMELLSKDWGTNELALEPSNSGDGKENSVDDGVVEGMSGL